MEIEKVYNLYFKDVFRYVYSLTKNQSLAEDITQDTFLKALKNIDKFDGSKDIRARLFTIAKNTLYTHYKREKIYVSYEEKTDVEDSMDVLETVVNKDTASRIEKILEKLAEPYKRVFQLRHYGELSYDEIANMYSKSSGWARIIFYRAKKQILAKMEDI